MPPEIFQRAAEPIKLNFMKKGYLKQDYSIPFNFNIENIAIFSLKHLYTNTVVDGSVILCVCAFALKTTFPLSNFQTKRIFRILTVLRKNERQSRFRWGAEGALNLATPRRPNFFKSSNAANGSVFQMAAGDVPNLAPTAALPWRARETPPKAPVLRVYRYT